jgi:hypothetical protein
VNTNSETSNGLLVKKGVRSSTPQNALCEKANVSPEQRTAVIALAEVLYDIFMGQHQQQQSSAKNEPDYTAQLLTIGGKLHVQ